MKTECVCGFSNCEKINKEYYIVTESGQTVQSGKTLELGKCINCGVVRQTAIPFENNRDYVDFYRNKYEPLNILYTAKDYSHDRNLAKKRCLDYKIGKVILEKVPQVPAKLTKRYVLKGRKHRIGNRTLVRGDTIDISPEKISHFMDRFELAPELEIKIEEKKEITTEIPERILDVGSGSGAFVDECRELGHEAYGCEIGKYSNSKNSPFIYYEQFENINFPTDHFDKITCHDVVEHSLSPIRLITEVFRILKQEGTFILDFPNYFTDAGNHHWKREHIWYFSIEDLRSILEKRGFIVEKIERPIPSKIVFYLKKPKQNRVKIIYPPGIGDTYWSIIKTQAFLKREKLDIPDIYIASPRDLEFEAHKRSFPFIEMFPFLNATRKNVDNSHPDSKIIWNEAYSRKKRTIFKNVLGYDYFISYNGHLRHGEQMEEIDADLECNWFPPMFVSLEQKFFQEECIKKYGKYIVFYFVFQGTYSYWTREFPIASVIQSVKEITEKTNCTPVFAGAIWDNKKDSLLSLVRGSIPNCVDLTGQTNIPQLFGLIKGSQAVVGYPSGLTIASTMFRVKTLIIWSDYYNRGFHWYSCPTSTRNKTYFIENTKGLNPSKLTSRVVELVNSCPNAS